jgi:hypothetical protein
MMILTTDQTQHIALSDGTDHLIIERQKIILRLDSPA